jgi:hypothetical protein
MQPHVTTVRSNRFIQFTALSVAFALAGLTGCSSVAPSGTAKGAGTGAVVGGLGGAVVGNNSSMGSTTGIAAGAALGAITGGIIGMVQDARDRREQDRLAQERAYGQEVAKRRLEESKAKLAMDEELAVAQGFRISDLEVEDAKKKYEARQEVLKKLVAERTAAANRTKELADFNERTLNTEAEIARMEEEIARLKGEDPVRTTSATTPAAAPAAATTSPAVKPGS